MIFAPGPQGACFFAVARPIHVSNSYNTFGWNFIQWFRPMVNKTNNIMDRWMDRRMGRGNNNIPFAF